MKPMNPIEIVNAAINLKGIEDVLGHEVPPSAFNQEELGKKIMNPIEIFDAAMDYEMIETMKKRMRNQPVSKMEIIVLIIVWGYIIFVLLYAFFAV